METDVFYLIEVPGGDRRYIEHHMSIERYMQLKQDYPGTVIYKAVVRLPASARNYDEVLLVNAETLAPPDPSNPISVGAAKVLLHGTGKDLCLRMHDSQVTCCRCGGSRRDGPCCNPRCGGEAETGCPHCHGS